MGEKKVKEYIVKTSATLIEEFVVEAKSKDEAWKKWCNSDYLDVKQTEINDPQIEEVREK